MAGISYKNRFFQKNNQYSRETHTYSDTDYIECYKGHSIWRYESPWSDDSNRQYDIVKDNVIVGMRAGIDGAKACIDELTK